MSMWSVLFGFGYAMAVAMGPFGREKIEIAAHTDGLSPAMVLLAWMFEGWLMTAPLSYVVDLLLLRLRR
jgi:hypothetical protein